VGGNGRQYHWVQNLDNPLIKKLSYVAGAAVETDGIEVNHACENELRSQIVQNINDYRPA
jgi:hypothetical protein